MELGEQFPYALLVAGLLIVSTAVWIANVFHRSKEPADIQPPLDHWVEQISRKTYEDQTLIHTKQEIRNLVESARYKEAMAVKGADERNWNWQMRDCRTF